MDPERSVMQVIEGALLWELSEEQRAEANITRYMRWLKERKGLGFDSYNALWQWSVTDLEGFWESIWQFFEVKAHRSYARVPVGKKMPGARWFVGAELNYAEHMLLRRDDHPAVVFRSEKP